MSQDKYYTPSIEEFHVGFNFEYITVSGNYKKYVATSIDIEEIYASIKLSNSFDKDCRVKYLDQEDIESLGFELLDNPSGIGYHLAKNINRIWLDAENIKHYVMIGTGIELVFKGIIKNKSELVKLMKQLNIEIK